MLAGPDKATAVGVPVAISGTFVDADAVSTRWSATVDDGTGPRPITITGSTFTTSVTFTATGTRTAKIQVCDNGSLCGTDEVIVTVTAPPSITVKADMGTAGLETVGFQPVGGVPYALVSGTFASAAAGPYTVSVRWNPTEAFAPVLFKDSSRFITASAFLKSGTRTVTVRVCAANGTCGTDDLTVNTGVTTKVTPIVECVRDNGAAANPRYTARFGYSNAATIPVYVATLPYLRSQLTGVSIPPVVDTLLNRFTDNKFGAAPIYRGQDQVFQPGRTSSTFSVGFASGNQAWTLNGTSVTASSATRRC